MSEINKVWRIEGMMCTHCERTVEKALKGANGIRNPRANYRRGVLRAQWDASLISENEIEERLSNVGYHLRRGSSAKTAIQVLLFLAAAVALYFVLTRTPVADWTRAFPVARQGLSLGALLLLGMTTSIHCVAMCGGISLSQASKGDTASVVLHSTMYNVGRMISYAITGAILGGLGGLITITDSARAVFQIVMAVLMLIMSMNLSGLFPFMQRFALLLPKPLAKLRLQGNGSFAIGLLNGLMPCGPLQAMQLLALSAGSWWMGALSMLCFAAGTVPLMLLFGIAGGGLNQRFGKPMRLISAGLVLAMAVSALSSGLAMAGVGTSNLNLVASKPNDGTPQVELVDGVQMVSTELNYGAYPAITVQAGVPVRWNFHAEADKINGCNGELMIPTYGIRKALQPGDNWIEFTPTGSGTVPYSCWMGMIRSTITVNE